MFAESFKYKLMYIFEIRDANHRGLLKIGDATIKTANPDTLFPNCKALNTAARERIKQYTNTVGVEVNLLHTELALRDNGKVFRDYAVHEVLTNSGINKVTPRGTTGKEWFRVDIGTACAAIVAVKRGRKNLSGMNIVVENFVPVTLRPEQERAINQTIKYFKSGKEFLWNAKMRFGKTLTALALVKRCKFSRTIIVTHRPVVDDGWYDDFNKIFHGEQNYLYGSKYSGNTIEELLGSGKSFVYFASIQDLRGSEQVGGKFDKNSAVFSTAWDFVIVDEAHEGTQTALGDSVIKSVVKPNSKFLALSGTPFNILGDYEENIFTWDYIMEQQAKADWSLKNFGDSNPYDELPQLNIYTYDIGKIFDYVDVEDKAFNFREFFRTDGGKFVHESDVKNFLALLVKSGSENYPYSKAEYRALFRHSLWKVPGVKEARALSKLLKSHDVFQHFKIVNVAGNGDADEESADALKMVREAIDNYDYTITLTCGKLTMGVTVPEWTAVFMLSGSYQTSAASYMQTIFRVQSPCSKNGCVKENCFVFDFAPDRTLKVIAESVAISARAGKTDENDRMILGKFLNFCPIISIAGSEMKKFDTNRLLRQLKRAYAERVVLKGFDDTNLYSDELLRLDDLDLKNFEQLKGIVGSSKAQQKTKDIDINAQGFTDEEYEKIKCAERKPQRERTPEEIVLLEEVRKKQRQRRDFISVLRGISIRMPLLIYGVDVPIDDDFEIEQLFDIDEASWTEFMPHGVTKELFRKFIKYYDPEIFVVAGHRIRNLAASADELQPTERIKKIAELFSTFKNPDKETVLTPWRVVNLHMSDCLGGWDFFDVRHENDLTTPRFVDGGQVTNDTLANVNAKILEINSKTGLYPLYVAYSIYRARLGNRDEKTLSLAYLRKIWDMTVAENIFVICKTPMAKAITRRTLLGFRGGSVNAHYFDDLLNYLKNKQDKFVGRVLKKSYWQKGGVGKMKFDAVVGNPPYQEMDNGAQASAKPIYNHFVEAGKKLGARYMSFIIPSRWYAGGKGLDLFRDSMLDDKHLEKLFDCLTPEYIFPNTNIRSGVCWFLRNTDFDNKKDLMRVVTIEKNSVTDDVRRPLKVEGAGIFIRHAQAISILNKVRTYGADYMSNWISARKPFGFEGNFVKDERFHSIQFMDSWVSPGKPFGFRGYFVNDDAFQSTPEKISNPVVCIGKGHQRGYVERELVSVHREWIDCWKVMIPYANNIGTELPDDNLNAFVGSPNEICTESYLLVGAGRLSDETSAENLAAYLHTRFARFMHSLAKASQHATAKTFCFVPVQDFSRSWTDEELYLKYGLSEAEIKFIEAMIKPMS